MKREVSVIIQARMGSTRLPEKVLKKLYNKPVLWHVVNRVKQSKYISNIIVATTLNKEDDIIQEYCSKNSIQVFRGSSEDVLDRYYQCAKKYKCKNIVRITADCPLHDASVIDKVIKKYIQEDYDYVSNTFEYTFPDGLDTEVFSFEVLEEAWKSARLISEREHVTPYIIKNDKYKKFNVRSDKEYPIYRLTLDCSEDYELIKRIYEGIGRFNFGLDEVIAYLKRHPDIAKLNSTYNINEGYEKSIREDRIME